LSRITRANVSSQLLEILKEYFSNRQMFLCSRHDKVAKQMTKGCPQGSIIGPHAWNWSMDDLLNKLRPLEAENVYATAYADDLALLICERSRVSIEVSALRAIEKIVNWSTSYKLQIAIDKTKAILVKGSFHHERMPRIHIYNKKIEFTNEHKYLGIH